ncbi:hypothetical protein NERG_01585 [Nematocida ausubeli]|uniref:RRM domain-containing protein n=1 Tax=Nematocida ausubeli (strain ATCC PRA-371 / ERTm2) TaxID=1913371 RepID=H8ZDB4_NEMA1|nr:hypothetical protein NERG_01585 [Nematocida ausubeli]
MQESAKNETYNKQHRVIATNMPFNISDEDILKHFNGAVSLERHAKKGVATGAVFIQCANTTDVNRFIKTLDGSKLAGREIRVAQLEDREVYKAKQKFGDIEDENAYGRQKRKEYENNKGSERRKLPEGEENRTVFITNISFKDTEEEVKEVFGAFGEVEQCTLVVNRETNAPTGRAFVLFKHQDSCKEALREQVTLNDRVLVVLKYVSPDVLKQRESDQKEKDYQREKTIKDRQEGVLEPRDPSKISSCRVHISHMDKKHTRKSISKVIENYFEKLHGKKLKLRGVNLTSNSAKRNPGYCFITFKFPEDAQLFLESQGKMRREIGGKMTAEYAMESKEFQERGIKKKPSKEDRIEKRNRKERESQRREERA